MRYRDGLNLIGKIKAQEVLIDKLQRNRIFSKHAKENPFLLGADGERLGAHLFSAGSIKLFRGRCNRRSSVICRRKTDQKGLLPRKVIGVGIMRPLRCQTAE